MDRTTATLKRRQFARVLFSSLIAALLAGTASAQRELTDIPVPDAKEELATFQMGDGWTAELFAGDESRLAKPIHMNWDNRGRLWVASSETYPQIVPGKPANDKILVLEDTDGDGRADKTTVFAEGLLIPTGVLPGNDGSMASAYVVNSDKLEYMVDRDGDLVADEKQVILSGFGTEDTHHLLHSLRWGHDGWLYMNQSIYIHSHIETPWGVERLNGGGIWRYHPSTKQLEVVARGFVNPWGVHFDRYGQMFATDGAYGEGINYVFPGSVFVTAVGGTRFLGGLNPGSPKHCGLEILSGDHWPENIRGSMVTNDFRAHRVCRFVVTDDRSGYESVQQQEVIKTTHVAFRPIDAKQGLDGHLYIADWYNPIIQHGEVDFRDPRRDRTHGRIWRLTHKDQKKSNWKPIDAKLSFDELASLMTDEADLPRLFATQAMRLKAPTMEQVRGAWAGAAREVDRLQWLWMLEGQEAFPKEMQEQLLRSEDGRIRAAAYHSCLNQLSREIRLARASGQPLAPAQWDAWLQRAKPGLADAHPRVRLETLRILAEIPTAESAALACQVLDQPMDRFLDFALWQTLRDLKDAWLPDFNTNPKGLNGKPNHIAFAMRAVQDPSSVDALLQLIATGSVTSNTNASELLQLAAELGTSSQQSRLLDVLLRPDAKPALEPAAKASIFAAILDGSKARKQVVAPSAEAKTVLATLSQSNAAGDQAMRKLALRAIGQWKIGDLRGRIASALQDSNSGVRAAAIVGLAAIGDVDAKKQVIQLTQDPDAVVSVAAIEQTLEFDLGGACEAIASKMSAGGVSDEAWNQIVRLILGKKGGADALASAVSKAKVAVAPETGRQVRAAIRSSGAEATKLLETIESAAKLKENRWVWSESLRDQWIAKAQSSGDPHRGEMIYRRAELQCVQCHRIAGVGGLVGPDLSSIGAQAPADYLLEALLNPAAKVKEGYNAKLIRTVDDEIVTGIPIGETDTTVTLRGADGKEIRILKESIDESKDSRSLMPDGLLDSLSEAEAIDLLRFMIEMGRIDGPMRVQEDGSLRDWKSLVWTQKAHQLFNRTSLDSVAGDQSVFTWQPSAALVSGQVPLNGTATFQPHAGMEPVTFLMTELQVDREGTLRLLLGENAKKGMLLWVQGVPTAIEGDSVQFDVKTGALRLQVGIKRPVMGDRVQIRVDRDKSTARVAP
ncbi:hypothetical protein VN12_23865 [Pirellula sp. SH-Sr6A]|uniref:PVC-type heme-binding CxxCH protein n=1 Tax=Pirellula sp. SH-Sr6A TaxID=1632865 RepID=UPI00078BFBC6|nr:PVC-type heme-binding CxxCH protein [Pirellula sp. SH-Sr6A]AMV35184.1 hypothetical protein VN12_23865 [Pirellula sp. SH-Sr6A]